MNEAKIISSRSDTVGAKASELMLKQSDLHTAVDLQRAQSEAYIKELNETILSGKKQYGGKEFFVVVLTRDFRKLAHNIFENKFHHRQTCPTPNYDQTVWKYNPLIDDIEYIWSIPCREACREMINNPLAVPKEEKELLKFILDYADGTLFRLCKKLNGETIAPGPVLERK